MYSISFNFCCLLLRSVSEELIVLITLTLCLRLTATDYGAFQTSALEMKNEGVDNSSMTADVLSQRLIILL